jgi:hypothetical protein
MAVKQRLIILQAYSNYLTDLGFEQIKHFTTTDGAETNTYNNKNPPKLTDLHKELINRGFTIKPTTSKNSQVTLYVKSGENLHLQYNGNRVQQIVQIKQG